LFTCSHYESGTHEKRKNKSKISSGDAIRRFELGAARMSLAT